MHFLAQRGSKKTALKKKFLSSSILLPTNNVFVFAFFYSKNLLKNIDRFLLLNVYITKNWYLGHWLKIRNCFYYSLKVKSAHTNKVEWTDNKVHKTKTSLLYKYFFVLLFCFFVQFIFQRSFSDEFACSSEIFSCPHHTVGLSVGTAWVFDLNRSDGKWWRMNAIQKSITAYAQNNHLHEGVQKARRRRWR